MLTSKETINLKHQTRTRGSHEFTTELGSPDGYCAVCKIDFTPTGKTFREPRMASACRRCGIVGQCSSVCGDVVSFGFRLISDRDWSMIVETE